MSYGTGTVILPIFRRTMVGACSLIAVYVTVEIAVKPLWAYTTTKWSKVSRTWFIIMGSKGSNNSFL